MEYKYTKERIELEKELNTLDEFVLSFTAILNKLNLNYVIVSGYVSILFGRNRSSEDVDIILEKITLAQFEIMWNELNKLFECIITENVKDAYNDYLTTGCAIRFSKKGEAIPNIEIKFPKTELDIWTLNNKKEILLNRNHLFISPLELQIPFKLFLGSEKDIEDARFLYNLFKDKLNKALLLEFNRKLNIDEVFNRYLT
ncbi:hypothetical protein HY636_06125 [Candidatus Woesearchaeota archaeon]|nr:hypothetical protein [Candidatus Woesearchaeota archaeon]